MAKRNISEEFNSVTFPVSGEYLLFEALVLSGNPKDYQEAFKMLKTKTEAKRRRKSQRDQSRTGGL